MSEAFLKDFECLVHTLGNFLIALLIYKETSWTVDLLLQLSLS